MACSQLGFLRESFLGSITCPHPLKFLRAATWEIVETVDTFQKRSRDFRHSDGGLGVGGAGEKAISTKRSPPLGFVILQAL